VIEGQVVDSQGRGLEHVRVVAHSLNCGWFTDSIGNFRIGGLPEDSVLLFPQALGFCVEPRWVPTDNARFELFVAVPERDPLDDSFVVVHGLPYTPMSYDELRCRAALRRQLQGSSAEAGSIPTPTEVFRMVMAEPAVIELLAAAARERRVDVVPVSFIYGSVEAPTPRAPIPYVLGGREIGVGIYVLVEAAEPGRLSVQVGRPRETAAEEGFQIEWRRLLDGNWGSAETVERWGR
jgi:hypothetical protein